MNIINRPILLEKVKRSILLNKITNIYGVPGSGKTAIWFECIKTFYGDVQTKIIYPHSIGTEFKIELDEGIYIFEESDRWINKNVVSYMYDNISNKRIRIILVSQVNLCKYNNRINAIQVIPPTKEEIDLLMNNKNRFIADENIVLNKKFIEAFLTKPLNVDNLNVVYKPCIIDRYGKPIDKTNDSIKLIVAEINDQLLYEISKDPKLLHNLSSYDFERVGARIFEKQGYSIEITPKTRDGGKDIFIAKQGLASFLFYVECKKYAPDRPVGIDIIQRLYGVISAEKANGGFIATTSHFTKPAENYIKEYNLEHQLTLQDYNTISDILKSLQYDTQ